MTPSIFKIVIYMKGDNFIAWIVIQFTAGKTWMSTVNLTSRFQTVEVSVNLNLKNWFLNPPCNSSFLN